VKKLLILSLCMSFPAFGMDDGKGQQEKASNEQLLKLLQEQAEWNKQTTEQLGEVQRALAAKEKVFEEREKEEVQSRAILFFLAPVVYYCARATLKNLDKFL
jgi:hypothetical protein